MKKNKKRHFDPGALSCKELRICRTVCKTMLKELDNCAIAWDKTTCKELGNI